VTKRTRWVLVAPLLGVVACANVWGFDDLTLAQDGGTSDATTPSDDQATISEGGGGEDGEADGTAGDDAFRGDAADAADGRGEGGEGGSIRAGDAGDGGDAGLLTAYCAGHCAGCCDSNGQCVNKVTITACGMGGAMCVDCPACSGLGASPCCGTTTGQCGCLTVGLLCSKN
jgi:hypothetical protein